MTRGIHLKHLTANDLGLLGLPEAPLAEDGADAAGQTPAPPQIQPPGSPPSPIPTPGVTKPHPQANLPLDAPQDDGEPDLEDEVPWHDPVLAFVTAQVRLTLEETLDLLDQALALGEDCRPR